MQKFLILNVVDLVISHILMLVMTGSIRDQDPKKTYQNSFTATPLDDQTFKPSSSNLDEPFLAQPAAPKFENSHVTGQSTTPTRAKSASMNIEHQSIIFDYHSFLNRMACA